MGWKIDYKKFYHYFAKNKEIYNAFFYTGTKTGLYQDNFLSALIRQGYTVRTKPVKQIIDNETGEIKEKCNLGLGFEERSRENP